MQLAQVAKGGVVHHQKGQLGLQAKVEDANDVGMHQVADVARFAEKAGQGGLLHLRAQDFEGDRGVQIEVLAQVDLGESASA